MLNPNIHLNILNEQEYIIFAKQLILNKIQLNGQKRLKKAKILVIGAGGLGCPIMMYLVRAGIGYLGIIDYDKIEISNLNRQILYNLNDIYYQKTRNAKRELTKINPYCKIILHTYKLNNYNAIEILQYYDIIIDATDNFKIRNIIDAYCYKLHKVHIYGAVQEFEGQVSVFNYQNNLRYYDIYLNYTNINENNCNLSGIIGTITGQIGILQATETIKIILGFEKIITNKILLFNFLDTSIKYTEIYLKKIYLQKSYKLYSNNSNNIIIINNQIINHILIDITEIYEFKQKHSKYSINIPFNQFTNKKTIIFLQKKCQNKIFIFCCTKMYRSLVLSKILQIHKIRHYILKN